MIYRVKCFFQEYKLAFLSGALLGLSWIPFPPWALLFWLLPVSWYWWNHSGNLKKLFISATITAFTLTLIGFYWIAFVSHVHGGIPWVLSILIMLLFCLLGTNFLPIALVIWGSILKKYNLKPFAKLVLLFLTLAFCERFYWTIFKWNFGYPFMWSKLPVYQLADIVGFNGLSFLTFLFNGLFFYAFLKFKENKPYKKLVVSGVSIFLLLNVLGELNVRRLPPTDKSTKVMMVQANIGNAMKMLAQKQFSNHKEILDRYVNLTKEALDLQTEPVDFVIWPETAIPIRLRGELMRWDIEGYLRAFIQDIPTRLISGSYHLNVNSRRISNAFYVFNNDGSLSAPPYKKTRLLAFGEYFPFYDSIGFMRSIANALNIGRFEPGNGPQTMAVGDLLVGPQICYESLFPDFSVDLAKSGAQVFINLTNDSWYGPTSEPHQNLYITLARGIEQRRPILRATNTGITTAVLADGTRLKNSPLFKEWAGVFNIPYHSQPIKTFYQSYPNLIVYLFSILYLLFLIKGRRSHDEE